MIEALKHRDVLIQFLESKVELSQEEKEWIEDRIVFAFRDGYELACKNDFDMKKL